MFEQMDFYQPEIVKTDVKDLSIQQAFEAFHASNPSVYDNLVKLARNISKRGRCRIGIGMLFEILRWNYMMHTEDPNSDFKLCNNYRSRYSRLIMENEPELDGVFETRELREKPKGEQANG